jgi:hypothetical protein
MPITKRFERLLNSRGIAIVGANVEASRPGGQMVLVRPVGQGIVAADAPVVLR